MADAMKTIRDIIEINAPNGFTFSFITLAEIKDISGIVLALTSAICTALITWHKVRGKKPKTEK